MSEVGEPYGDERFSPVGALENAAAVDARARRRARWPAWVWLVLGVAMPLHLLGTQLGDGSWVEAAVAWLPVAVAVGGVAYCAVQRIESRLARRLEWPVTWAFVALVVLDVVLRWTLLADGPAAAVVVFGLLPAVPPFYAAWRVLRG